jgi:hypothetical protein
MKNTSYKNTNSSSYTKIITRKIKETCNLNSEDYKLGCNGEKRTFEVLQEVFPNIQQYKEFFSPYDYFVKNNKTDKLDVVIELKTRRLDRITQFKDIAFGYTKLQHAENMLKQNQNLKVFVCWRINNGDIYFWRFDGTNYGDFRVGHLRNVKMGQDLKKCCFVDTSKLKLLTHQSILSA